MRNERTHMLNETAHGQISPSHLCNDGQGGSGASGCDDRK